MTNCSLEFTGEVDGKFVFACDKCGRSIALPARISVIRRCIDDGETEQDDSQVGSVLKGWFAKAGYTATKECRCNFLAAKLDSMTLSAIKVDAKRLAEQIKESAKSQSVDVPLTVVSAALRLAVWREDKRLRKG